MRDVIEVYTEVANKVKDISDYEQLAVVEGLAGKYHISRMQALLDDLGSADSMYYQMYETSKNSAGSAMRENEVYMRSLQARINLARVEVEKLAVAFGEAFLTEGMVTALTVFSSFTSATSGFVNFIGGLPLILGAASTALLLLSTRFRTLVTAMMPARMAALTYTTEVDRTTAANRRAEVQSRATGKAWRAMTLSLGVTVPLMIVSVAFEKLLAKMSETRQRMEELESANKDMMNSYTSNASELDSLIVKYGKLSEAMKYDVGNTELMAEYRDVQNQIGNLMPSLITGEDAYGNKIVDTYEALKIKTDLLKEQIALEKEKALAEERATREDKIELEVENLEDANDKIADYAEMLSNGWKGSNSRNKIPLEFQVDMKVDQALPEELNSIALKLNEINGTNIKSDDVMGELSNQPVEVLDEIAKHLSNLRDKPVESEDLIETLDGEYASTLEDFTAKLKELQKARANAEKSGLSSEQLNAMDIQIGQIEKYIGSLNDADFAQRQAAASLKSLYVASIKDVIDEQSTLTTELKELASTLGSQLIDASTKDNVDELGSSLEKLFTNMQDADVFEQVMRSFENLGEMDAESAESTLEGLLVQIGALEKELGTLGLSKEEVSVIMEALNGQYDDAVAAHTEIIEKMEEEGISYEEAAAGLAAYSETMETSTSRAEEFATTMGNLSDSVDRLVGKSADGVSAAKDLFFEYDILTQRLKDSSLGFGNLTQSELNAILTGKNLTYEQQQLKDAYLQRKEVLETLGAVFPEILAQEEYALDLSSQSVEAARIENEAKRALGKAYQIMKDDVLDAEQQASFNKINQTNTRIEAIKAEMKASQNLSLAYSKFAEAQTKLDAGAELSHNEQMAMMYGSKFVDDGTSDVIKELNKALDIEIKALDTSTKSFDTATAARKESTSATKEATEASEDKTKQLNAEELAQEALNEVTEKYTLTLEKLANAQKKVQNNQKKYGTYSKKYRDALAEENKLIQQQIELNKQQATDLEALNGKTFNAITYNAETGQIVANNGGSGGNNPIAIKNGKLQGWQDVITDVYGSWRTGADGKKYQHSGIDLDGKIGDALAANVRGKVVKTSNTGNEKGRSGKFVQILDEDGIKHHYGHLNKVMVAVGQLVEIGEQIGEIGNTGNVKSRYGDGSHLHYEVWGTNGKNFNPIGYVNKAKNQTYSAPTQKTQTVNVNVNNSSSKGTGNFSNANEAAVWNFFKNNGFSDAATAGIIGNLKQESTAAIDPTMPQRLANGKIGVGRGIAQWTVDERWAILDKWAKNNGKDKWAIETQLEYILMELEGRGQVDTYTSSRMKAKGGLDKLKSATNAKEAAILFEQVFTRAGKPNNTKRINYANDALNRLSGTGAVSTGKGVISDGYYTEETTHTLNTLSEIEALRAENEELANQLQENYYKSIQSKVEEFDRNRQYEDNLIESESAKQEQYDVSSKEYENSLNRQFEAEKRKLEDYQQELEYIKAVRQAGGLTDLQSDQLLDRIKEIETAIIESTNEINAFYYENVATHRERFEKSRQSLDNEIARQDARQANLSVDGTSYEESVNKQYNSEKKKLALYEQELRYLQKILVVGNLTQVQSAEITEAIYEVQMATMESASAIKEYYSNVVSSYLARYDSAMKKHQDILDWEETKIKGVDVASERYNKTLQKMIDARKSQVSIAEKELAYSEKILKSGELSNDMYSELSERVKELKKELVDLNEVLHETNYELIQTGVKVRAEDIDDVDFEIERSQKIRNMYDEGSADYIQEMTFELGKLEEKLKMLWDNGEKIQKDMQGKDLGHQQLKDLEEQLEDNALAYWDVNNAISALKKEMKDMSDIIDDQVAEKRSDMIEKAIEALKDAYEELKEIKMSELDELIDLENDRHDKVMKNYRDELESFTKIIDAQRRQLDDSDRDRTHEMNIEELINEKQTHQKRLNVIGHINTYEAKKEREELQKQIAEIDKKIAEENYQYDRELRYQQLDDALEAKTEHIENLEEAEDKHNQEVLKDLEKQKSYWEKHYSDLINDEERWNSYRKTMMDGDAIAVKKLLDGIQLEFDSLSAELTASLPKLEDTFDGTWKAVGTQIRENVIANLKLIRDEMAEVEKEAQELLGLKDKVTMEHGSSLDTMPDKSITDKDSDKISEANLKVILAKFMNEQIAGKLNSKTDASRIKNIKEKSYTLAAEGRAEGATIEANKSIKEVFDGLNTDQVKQVGDYFSANANQSGFITQDYLDYIQQFGQQAQQGGLLTQGDKQVLMAKYLKEKLANESKNTDEKMAIREIADNMAASGRINTSIIKGNVGYDEQVRKLSKQQREELGIHMKQNANVIANGELRSKLEDYGNRLQLSYTDDMVHLNTGGMTRAFGSSGGVDGKGGRMAVLHQNEIVNNPIDSAKLLETSTIMESIMNSIRNVVKSPISNIKSMLKPSEQVASNGTVNINFNVDRMYANEAEVESFGKKIEKKLFRTKGRR